MSAVWQQPLADALREPAPWLVPYAELAAELLQHTQSSSLVQALNSVSDAMGITLGTSRLRFVPHAKLPGAEAYESFIHRTACVPTRENMHDLFNGLVWLKFPQAKWQLHTLQASELSKTVTGEGGRGAIRDALTVFDENGAVLEASQALHDALHHRDWRGLFVQRRSAWVDTRVTIFGHALLEKLISPRKAMTAHVWWRAPNADDRALAQAMAIEQWPKKPFAPLPVLGIPGWCEANEQFAFYEDAEVFRPSAGRFTPAAVRRRASGCR